MALPKRPIQTPKALVGMPNGRLHPRLLETIPASTGSPIVLARPAARAFKAMRAAAAADGIILYSTRVSNSYRPYEDQQRIFLQRYRTYRKFPGQRGRHWNGRYWYHWTSSVAAAPGTSNHGDGLAVDIVTDSARHRWLLRNADRFGWSWEIDSEKWHIVYWAGDGVPKAVLDYERHLGVQVPPTKVDPSSTQGSIAMMITFGWFVWLLEGWQYRLVTSPQTVNELRSAKVPEVNLSNNLGAVKELLGSADKQNRYHRTELSRDVLKKILSA